MFRQGFLLRSLVTAVALGAVLTLAGGCNEEVPADEPLPEGKGSLVLSNLTADTVNVYVGGVQTTVVAAVSQSVVYMYPGLYRVVLDQEGGTRNYRDDVDILRGRRTILHIGYSTADTNLYSVVLEFD
jgi:hypothetical protein